MTGIQRLFRAAILLILVSSCRPAPGEMSLIERTYPAGEISAITITMDRGSLLVREAEESQTSLLVIANPALKPVIQRIDDRLVVDLPQSKPGDRIELVLAGNPDLDIQAFDSLIELISPGGEVFIRNTAGDTLLHDYQGPGATLWAGRGNVTVQEGRGKLIIAGEHGKLNITNFLGQIAAATIMGKIQYESTQQNIQDVLLEADHGPIHASIPTTSSYQINITSASGEIVCFGSDLRSTSEGCQGTTEDGQGHFTIRTVSGRIEFQILDQQ